MQYINTQVNETAVEFNITGEMFFLKQSSAPVQVAFNNKENGFITLQQGEKVFLQFDKLYIKTLKGIEDISFITSSNCNGDIEGKKFEEKGNKLNVLHLHITDRSDLNNKIIRIFDENPYRKSLIVWYYRGNGSNKYYIGDNELMGIGDTYPPFAMLNDNAGIPLRVDEKIVIDKSNGKIFIGCEINDTTSDDLIIFIEETAIKSEFIGYNDL